MMSLNDEEVDLLRVSFRRLAGMQPGFALVFYDRLFDVAPETRALFSGDMEQQGVKMMSTLGAIVAQLHQHDALRPMAADLARRHVTYGVGREHYALLGEALIWAVEHALDQQFTPPLATAWRKAYDGLATTMIEAAYGPENRPV